MKTAAIKKAAVKVENTFKKNGYENAYDFHKRSGVGVAYYTIVRFLDPTVEKPPSLATLIEIAYYAGCKPDEIKEILDSIGDTFWSKLIANHENQLSAKESALIEITRAVVEVSGEYWESLASNLKLYAKAAGIYKRKTIQDCIAKLGG